MGQGQSQASASGGRTLADTQDPQGEPPSAEQAKLDRDRRAAAAQQRFDEMQKKKQRAPASAASGPPKKKTALEELSAENRGWRAADEQADLRAWN